MANQNSIFRFSNYRAYLKNFLNQLPQKRGALKAWAHHLRVHSTLVSQVMMGKREFSEEQGYELSVFIGHNSLEQEYFLELIRLERAGSANLKKHYKVRLEQLKEKAQQLSSHIQVDRQLTDREAAIFYSSWIYSGIRLCCSIGDGLTVDEIVQKTFLPRKTVVDALGFLRESGFVKQNASRYQIGTQYTHLGKGSPYLIRHQSNWRLKALQKADHLSDQELMYTAPFSIAAKDFPKIREQMVEVIQDFLKTVKASNGEIVACFNLDLFKLTE